MAKTHRRAFGSIWQGNGGGRHRSDVAALQKKAPQVTPTAAMWAWLCYRAAQPMRKKAIISTFGALAAISAVALLIACAAELPGPQVCSATYTCPDKQLCVLGRCRKASRVPITDKASRQVMAPVDVAQISSGSKGGLEIPEILVLGRQDDGPSKLLLRFALKLPKKTKLQRALLVLEPLPKCTRLPGRLRLELSHILSPWNSKSVSWARQPKMSLPMAAADQPAVPPKPIRLDVTELVRQWAQHRSRYHGLALIASGTSPSGVCYASGLSWGQGPRLELYLLPKKKKKKKKAKTDAGAADGGKDAGIKGDGSAPKSDKQDDDD